MEVGKPTLKFKLCETRPWCLCDATLVSICPVHCLRQSSFGISPCFSFCILECLLRLLSKGYPMITYRENRPQTRLPLYPLQLPDEMTVYVQYFRHKNTHTHIYIYIHTYTHIGTGGTAAIREPTLLPPQPRDNNTINDRSLSPMWAIRPSHAHPSPCPPTATNTNCVQCCMYVEWAVIEPSGVAVQYLQLRPSFSSVPRVGYSPVDEDRWVCWRGAVKAEETFWNPLPCAWEEVCWPTERWVQGSIWWLRL